MGARAVNAPTSRIVLCFLSQVTMGFAIIAGADLTVVLFTVVSAMAVLMLTALPAPTLSRTGRPRFVLRTPPREFIGPYGTPVACTPEHRTAARDLRDPEWLRANGMMLTASLLDTINDLDEYARRQRTPDPPTPTLPPGVAFNYPCGCTVSALTKGGHVVIPCPQHREGSASPAEPPHGMTFEEFRTAQRKPCGCIENASGPAYPGAPHAVHTTTIPCLQHRASRTTTLLLWPPDPPPSPEPNVSRETAAKVRADAERDRLELG